MKSATAKDLKQMHMTPAAYVVFVFKGVRATARAIGCHPTAVSKWSRPKEKKGCGGKIPRAKQELILDIARAHNLDINANDLIYGRTVEVPHE